MLLDQFLTRDQTLLKYLTQILSQNAIASKKLIFIRTDMSEFSNVNSKDAQFFIITIIIVCNLREVQNSLKKNQENFQ